MFKMVYSPQPIELIKPFELFEHTKQQTNTKHQTINIINNHETKSNPSHYRSRNIASLF